MRQGRTGRVLAAAVVAIFAAAQVPATALADGRWHGTDRGGPRDRHHGGDHRRGGYHDHGRTVVVVRPNHRPYTRPYRTYAYRPAHRVHRGHGHHDDGLVLFGLGLATVGLFALLNQQQQVAHDRTQVYATTAPVGRTITWNDGNAAGSVVVTRDGHDQAGRYCREYQHTVTIAGRQQQAWGTACQQPDGDWQIVE